MNEREKFIAILGSVQLEKADVIILLQGDGLSRVARAAELYKQGFASRILVLGGADNRAYGSYPGKEIREELLKLVPADALIYENRTLNTKDEAVRAIELAKEQGWKKLLLVTSPHHQYRAFLTFLRTMRQADMNLVLVNATDQLLSWFSKNPYGRRIDLFDGEVERIQVYQDKGDVSSFNEGIEYLELLQRNQSTT